MCGSLFLCKKLLDKIAAKLIKSVNRFDIMVKTTQNVFATMCVSRLRHVCI